MTANLPPRGGDVRQDRGGREGSRRKATRALPQIVGSIINLIAFCGGLGFMISHVLDPLTAYLATSPGGLAIIAAAAQHVAFVMARCNRPASSSCCWSDRAWRGWWREV